MDIRGEHRFAAPRELVYIHLLDPALVERSLPGCESFVQQNGAYDITMRIGIGALKGVYRGRVRVVEEVPPESYRLELTGSGSPGGITGRAHLVLTEAGPTTVLTYVGDLQAKGAMASLGIQALGGSAKILIGQFLKAMEQEIRARTV